MSLNAPPMNVNPNFTSASLYVGDLSPDVTEALLFEIFNAVGPVASIRVCRDAVSRRSLGYAYVNFHSVTDAERALDTMNFSNIRGKPCRIMWSQRDPSLRKSGVGNIFVKNLDKSIDHKTLYDTFSMFGNILSCKVATNDKGESLGYGFVHYETEEAAKKAIEKVDKMVIASHEVHVAPFKPKSERDGPDNVSYTNIYVKNLPEDVTYEWLQETFGEYGKITSAHLAVDEGEKPKGFAFINFENPQEAYAAVQALHETKPLELYVARAQKKAEREKELRTRFDKLKEEQAKKYQGINLYIKNLDDSVDDKMLEEEFGKYGQITSAKVMRDVTGTRSKGFGFVCFTKKEEATQAVTEMNGKIVAGKPLYVALAQRKEERRAALEAQAQHSRQKINAGMPPQQMFSPAGPMFYPGPQQAAAMRPRQFGYPMQQMIPQQWSPRTPPPHMQAIRAPQPMPAGYGMVPAGMVSRVPQQPGQQQMRPAAGAGRGRPTPKTMQQRVPQGQPQQNSSRIQYKDNVRNAQNHSQTTPGGPQGATPGGPAEPPVQEPLTSQALAAAPAVQQKQMIGERIFPLIQRHQPKLAGKITGMLLEMDNTELLHLLESPDALLAKINEALNVLRQHAEQQGKPSTEAQTAAEQQ